MGDVMAETRMQLLEPEAARQVLNDFVAEAEQTPPLQTYQELQRLVRPEVTSALASLILKTGRPPKYPQSGSLAVLEAKQGRRMVEGIVNKGCDAGDEPVSIYLAEFQRELFRFKRRRWVTLDVTGVNHGNGVDTGDEFYIPSLHSDDTIGFYRDELGEHGSPRNGLELAGKAIRERPRALNSFLTATAELTKQLVKTEAIVP